MPRGPVLIVKTDLSSARLITPTAVREWTAPTLPDDRAPTVREAKARANAAASWIARDPDAKRRIDAIYTDVEESMCIWMRTTSPARPVVAAQLRALAQEWGSDASVLAVEPLRKEAAAPTPKRKRTTKSKAGAGRGLDEEPEETDGAIAPVAEPTGFAVIAMPDSMTRLTVNAADAAGTRIGMVATVWHLLAEAGAPKGDDDTVGVIMIDAPGGRVVWSWADATGLIAGGAARLDAESPGSTHQRVALDWLTWAAQLGGCPARLLVIGDGANEFAAAFGKAWQEVPSKPIDSADPMRTIVEMATAQPAPHRSGRRSLVRITHRPTRATRARYQFAGAAMVLLLIAISSVSFRLWRKSEQWSDTAAQVRTGSLDAVRAAWPNQAKTQQITNARRFAETMRDTELRETRPFEAPPRPRPILQEVYRIAGVLAARDETPDDGEPAVRLTHLILEQETNNSLSFDAGDRQAASDLIIALNSEAMFMSWERELQNPNPVAPRLKGTWTKETE